MREYLRDIVELRGLAVIEAVNGREGLDALDHSDDAPSLILLDLMMPEMDGWVFAATLRANPRFATVPIVLFSAVDDLAAHARALGAIGYLRKPGDLQQLYGFFDRYCA